MPPTKEDFAESIQTVDGALTYGADGNATKNTALRRSNLVRRDDVLTIPYVDVPPYPINNGNGRLSAKTVSPNATHYGGLQEYNVHNLWGFMEEEATNNMFLDLRPGKRPFMVSRSTFSGSVSTYIGCILWDELKLKTGSKDRSLARRQLLHFVSLRSSFLNILFT